MIDLFLVLSPIVSLVCVLISAWQLVTSIRKPIYLCIPNPSVILVSGSTSGNYLFSKGEIYYKLVPQKDAEIVYGRNKTAQIRASQSQVATSARHFRIYWNSRCWMIEDLNSTNGTYLNGIALSKGQSIKIKIGDNIHAGTVDMVLKKSLPVSESK